MRLINYTKKKDPSNKLHVGIHVQSTNMVMEIEKAFLSIGVDFPKPFTMKGFIGMGERGISLAKKHYFNKTFSISVSKVVFKAPIFDPEKIICIGMNYVDHCTEQNIPVPTEPVVFSKFANAIASPGDPILLLPGQTEKLDFEVEMVIVIGKEGKSISEEKAMEHVLGYTVAHDVSARDWQLERNGGQWLFGKTFDGYCPIGPAIVTTEELGDPHNLGIRCFLNNKKVQDSNTNQLVFKTEAIIAWVSRYITLKPGDLILTGTPPGVGCFRKPPLFLKDGDVVRVEIDKIGSITNTVKAEEAKIPQVKKVSEEYKTKLTKKSEKKVHGGTVIQYEHLSTSTKTQMVFSVFLPSVPSATKVPALYYLSGLTCTDQNFITKAAPYAMAAAYGIAIIAPDTSPRGIGIKGEDANWDFGTGAGFYVDATETDWKNNYNMYTYVTQELPSLVEKELPLSSKKSIFGHSMGGHGALICYLKNPDMYESCSAFSPICNPMQCPWGQKAFNGYLGSDKKMWEAYDATCLVKNYTGSKYEILIDQGSNDDFLEKGQLLPEKFVESCNVVNFPVKLRMQDGYDHSYFFIQSFIEDHIKHHANALGCSSKRSIILEKDVTELKTLLKHSKSPRIQRVLSEMMDGYSADLGRKIKVPRNGVAKQEVPENMPEKIKSVKRRKKHIYWNSIIEYSWDQNDQYVKVNIGKKYLAGVGEIDKENVKCQFDEDGFMFSVTNLKDKNYKLTMKNLSKDYVPNQSKVWIGKNRVQVKLRKVKEKYGPDQWYDLTSETKFKANKDMDKDPSAGLMDMMKKMYDDGDEKMKETIGKAMLESRNKQNKPGGFDPPSFD